MDIQKILRIFPFQAFLGLVIVNLNLKKIFYSQWTILSTIDIRQWDVLNTAKEKICYTLNFEIFVNNKFNFFFQFDNSF